MTYNQPYLPRLAEKFGLKKVMDLVAYRLSSQVPMPDRIHRVVEKLQKRARINLRALKMSDFNGEIQRIREVYNLAWQHNWGFVPLSEEEFAYIARHMKQIVDQELIIIAEYDNRPVGFLMSLPDINQGLIHLKGKLFPFGMFKLLWHTKIRNKIKNVRVVTMGVIPDFQKRGVDTMMYLDIHRRAGEQGYEWAELSWVLETNELARNALEELGAELCKRYRIVEMPL